MSLVSDIEVKNTSLLDHNIQISTAYIVEVDTSYFDTPVDDSDRLSNMNYYYSELEWNIISELIVDRKWNDVFKDNSIEANLTIF